jgi:phage terminase large subunit
MSHQWDFINAQDRFVLLSGGIGSGKSFTGAHYAIRRSVENKMALGLIGANTYKQLRNATLSTLFGELEKYGIPFSYKENKGHLDINGKKWLTVSLENYDSLRGIEIGDFWIDETRDTPLDAFLVLMGRLRDRRSKDFQGRLTTSPSGYNWLYDYFVGEKKTTDFKLIRARSADNIFLPDGYIDSLKDSFDSKMVAQELDGEFVNITADQVYYSFSRQKNVREFQRKNYPIWIGMDFNVNPMTAVCAEIYDNTIWIFDEIYLNNSNTYLMRDKIREMFGMQPITVIPDSTGRALKTSSAGLSDHALLKEYGFVIPKVHNPFVQDRWNCVNGLLEKARIIIHPRCKMLIKDFEQVSRGRNEESLTHISDACGYLAFHTFPINARKETRVLHYA